MKVPEGHKKCPNSRCKDGQVQQYRPGVNRKLEPTGKIQCHVCGGAGSIPDPKYIARLRKNADRLERDANGLMGSGKRELVRDKLNDAKDLRDRADRLERG